MKIGYDAKRVFHNFRGLGNYSRTLVESLLKYYPQNEYHLYTPPFDDERALEWQRMHPEAIIHMPKRLSSRIAHPLWRSFGLSSRIKKDELDIYHGLTHELPQGIDKVNVKKVVTIHDLIFMRFPDFFPWIDRKIYLRKFTYAVEVADVVVAICEQTKQDLIEFLHVPEDKIKVVYQSCSPLFYETPGESAIEAVKKKYSIERPVILFVGALEKRKNVLTLVDSFLRIKDELPHQLILIGDGKEYRKQIERKLIEHGITSRVKILDSVPQHELPAFYRLSDLFAFPSLFEGFGIPIIEALYSGVPVLTSNGPVFPEAGGEHSYYVDPHRADEIAEGMLKICQDRKLHFEMSSQGRVFVEKFHRKVTAKNMMDLYFEL
ncbi:MAG: hypothetical protein COW00_05050 [Bdellovibrio sp. CG12_big_fil_rev_8_21_14_0_65_39_13]|nr:MAG: hypothetical protein COW78_13250 [Bdellovibrio sp. CG22_combo_CG10-13_8_21_14_all_39_27]PIQ61177.1 MAG: hypothetical protein COW00_05050 [Bdellovibrio sp. CG12_big_fil_rev_8_21_14_0_65_39_13]